MKSKKNNEDFTQLFTLTINIFSLS